MSQISHYMKLISFEYCKSLIRFLENFEKKLYKCCTVVVEITYKTQTPFKIIKQKNSVIDAETDLEGAQGASASPPSSSFFFCNHLFFCNHFEELQTVLIEVKTGHQ